MTTKSTNLGPYPDYLRRHTETRGFMLGRPQRPRPTPDGKSVLFLRTSEHGPELRLYEFDVATARTRELLSPRQLLGGAGERLSPEERARRERMRLSARGFTTFEMSRDGAQILLPLSGRLFLFSRADGRATELATGDQPVIDPQLSPNMGDATRVAYVKAGDLHVLDIAAQKERRLTESPHPLVTNGLAEFIAQEEMHRFTGFCWAPDGTRLLFEEADSRGVEMFHIGDPLRPEVSPATAPYPRPGKANARVRVGMITLRAPPPKGEGTGGGEVTWLHWDADRFPYLASFGWAQGAPPTIVVQDRHQHDLELLAADPQTGRTTRLLAEHDDAWINLDQQMPRWLERGAGFLWTTERRGGWELELRDPRGELQRVIVPREAGYRGVVDVDERAGHVLVEASPDPAQLHLLRFPLAGGAPEPLTSAPGVHRGFASSGHRVYACTSSVPGAMPRTTVHHADGTEAGELPDAADTPPFRPHVELTEAGTESFKVAIVRPRAFVAGRKYPVVVDVYGGPGHLHVLPGMERWLLGQWLADHGFIVVAIDGRGTPARGRQWERALAGDFAGVTLDDQVAALQALGQRHPELDLDRVGIYGWSFGGYMAALAVMKRPDVFKVGVAGAPVVDWQDYDTHYTERYLGLPAENPRGYGDSSLLTHARDLSRPLLVIHGTADDNVYFLHSLKLSDALFRAGRPHELLPLSGLTHMVPDPLVAQRLQSRIVSFIGAALGGAVGVTS